MAFFDSEEGNEILSIANKGDPSNQNQSGYGKEGAGSSPKHDGNFGSID